MKIKDNDVAWVAVSAFINLMCGWVVALLGVLGDEPNVIALGAVQVLVGLGLAILSFREGDDL